MYTYHATVKRVVDGDTIEFLVDLGFKTYREETVRLLGIDCPEKRGPTKENGLEAEEFTKAWLKTSADDKGRVTVITVLDKTDGFRRVLGVVMGAGGESLAGALRAAGLFVPSKYDS